MTEDNRDALIQSLVERTSAMLGAHVVALDDLGRELADAGGAEGNGNGAWLQVRFNVLGQTGRLQVEQPPALTLSREVLQNLVDLVVHQIVLVECLPPQHQLKNQFIHRLLHGSEGSEDDLIREGQILNMDLSRPRAILLIDAGEYLGLNERAGGGVRQDGLPGDWLAAQAFIRQIVRFFTLPSDAICAYVGQGEIAVLKASTSQDLDPWARRDGDPNEVPSSWSNLGALKNAAAHLLETLEQETRVPLYLGVGRYHPGIRGLARSYQDARMALAIGRRLSSAGRLYCLDQLGLAALAGITDEQTRVDLAMHLLGPLENEPELIHTLITFFEENCSPASTANRLYVHRNTLNYRLEKIGALIGLNPRRFDDATLIRYALVICQLSGRTFLCNCPNQHSIEARHSYNGTVLP